MRIVSTLLLVVLLAAACTSPDRGRNGEVAEKSVRPGINKRFVGPSVDVDWAVGAFECESREIYSCRGDIVRALGLAQGESVADIGAGSGLFLPLLASAVGAQGEVYALDISAALVEHMKERVHSAGLQQVTARLSGERSVDLPEGSVDVVFTCGTYHHFEYPASMLQSIHAVLRPGGRLVVVDFERIPGTSSKWVLGHVRVGKEDVRKEVEAAGFRFLAERTPECLSENYVILFARP